MIRIEGTNKLINKISQFGADAELMSKQELQATALDIVNDMVRDAPVDTGNLRQQIVAEAKNNDLSYQIDSKVEYSVYLEYGTRAHTIEVVNAKVLSNGKTFFGKKVNHPGTQPRPFFWDNFYNGGKTLNRRLQSVLDRLRNKNK